MKKKSKKKSVKKTAKITKKSSSKKTKKVTPKKETVEKVAKILQDSTYGGESPLSFCDAQNEALEVIKALQIPS